jgi:hypothetical protein
MRSPSLSLQGRLASRCRARSFTRSLHGIAPAVSSIAAAVEASPTETGDAKWGAASTGRSAAKSTAVVAIKTAVAAARDVFIQKIFQKATALV